MKKILSFLVVAACTISIVACGTSKGNEANQQKEDMKKDVMEEVTDQELEMESEVESGEVTVEGVLREVTEDGFTLILEDETTLSFEIGAATRIMLENGLEDDLEVSVLYMGDGTSKSAMDRTLLMVDKVK